MIIIKTFNQYIKLSTISILIILNVRCHSQESVRVYIIKTFFWKLQAIHIFCESGFHFLRFICNKTKSKSFSEKLFFLCGMHWARITRAHCHSAGCRGTISQTNWGPGMRTVTCSMAPTESSVTRNQISSGDLLYLVINWA